MAEGDKLIELLFFDTFSHDVNEDLNLDLVQFPEPVYITEVRIIPLGARVQADFPGGVRLGATNPSKFHIELFVNDLAKPGASAFESLGDFEYNQNDCIHLQCPTKSIKDHVRQIPTDGLVLRGWYTTITLAVYGSMAKDSIGEQPISSPPAPVVQVPVPTPAAAVIAPVVIPSEASDLKVSAISTDVDWPKDDAEPKAYEPYQKEPVAAHYGSKGLVVRSEESLRQVPIESEANQTFVESWTPLSTTTPSSRAKTPEHESWDDDETLNKPTSCIASPVRPSRRSRSPTEQSVRRSSSKGDWSKSPEYRHSNRRRSYDRGVLDKKLMKSREYDATTHRSPQTRPPRTPSPEAVTPVSSRRPPRTPERRPSEEFNRNKALSPKSASDDGNTANLSAAPVPDEDTMSQGEPFEPILSDEEMGDDLIEPYELEYDEDDDVSFDLNLKQFNPFLDELMAYSPTAEISENAKELTGLATKCLNRAKIKDIECTSKSFVAFQTSEMRENWVHATEQLLQIVHLIQNSTGLSTDKSRQMIKTVIESNTAKLIDWVKIGLDFECANSQQQPGYKIRHIKCGVRLVEVLGADEAFIRCLVSQERFDIFSSLFSLSDQKHMALSIKLMICKAMYACLDTKYGVEFFTSSEDIIPAGENAYHKLINALQQNPLTRIKFALKSILKKVNLFESLQSIREIVTKNFVLIIKEEDADSWQDDQYLLKKCLEEVWTAYTWDAQSYSQPKRFLPVAAKFDNLTDTTASKQTINSFIRFFRIHAMLESLLLIISNRNKAIISEEVFDAALNLIEALCSSDAGLEYLKDNIETTNVLAKCLLQVQQKVPMETVDLANQSNDFDNIADEESRLHQLGLEISYKIKTKYCLDAIADTLPTVANREELLFDIFQTLYNMATFSPQLVRNYVINTITMDNNILIILKQIECEKKIIIASHTPENTSNLNGAALLKDSRNPILSYAIDLIDLSVRHSSINLDYLRDHGQALINLVKSHDQYEPDISNTLQELGLYLKPLEIQTPFSYDNIVPLCEIIRRNLEFVATFPGELIMALRIIRYLAIPNSSIDPTLKDENLSLPKIQHKFHFEGDQRRVELKHKFVILQWYSTDGISMCVSILDKLTAYFAQPAVHVPTLSSTQGVSAAYIILPTVEMLRRMISYVVECRNTDYKDLTAIESLLKTYTLMSHIPPHSVIANEAGNIQSEIVRTLLAYTQPMSLECVDTELIHKSLWTQMIAELCKYTLSGPHTFMAGIMAFISLLPVPLPIPTKRRLSSSEVNRLVTQRQLWSAHLHPNSLLITDLIQTLCVSSYTPLLDTLSRLIVQLADLAPNMANACVKAVIELLPFEGSAPLEGHSDSVDVTATSAIISAQTKRVLGFLTGILGFPSVKATFLSNFHGKVHEFLLKVLALKPTTADAILLPVLNQMQEHVLTIFHTLMNVDINLVGGNAVSMNADVKIAYAMPPKECIPGIISAILDHFLIMEGVDTCSALSSQFAALKALTILTEHDFTTYHLRNLMEKQKDKLHQKLATLTKPTRDEDYDILVTFLLFLQALVRKDAVKTERIISITDSDLSNILSYKNSENPEDISDKTIHPLLALETNLTNKLSNSDISDDLKSQIEEVTINLKSLLNVLNEGVRSGPPREIVQETVEPPFGQSEGIVHQYSIRPIFTLTPDLQNPLSAEQLTTSYWCSRPSPLRLEDPAEATEPSYDTTPCDLMEVIKTCLPPETNLTSDCKRLLHLSASPQSNRDRTTTAPCFRTRRVEVEPMTGRPEKKLYVSRGRPYPRTPASRSDLFRSRPPNTSRPPSLHVDDFLALETCGAQPTGPTGYNKLSREIISIRGSRGRGRSGFDRSRLGLSVSGSTYRQSRRNSPSTWANHESNSSQHFRTATAEPVISSHFQSEYPSKHFSSSRARPRTSLRPPRSFNR